MCSIPSYCPGQHFAGSDKYYLRRTVAVWTKSTVKKNRTLDEFKAFAESQTGWSLNDCDGPRWSLIENRWEAARERILTRYNVLKEQISRNNRRKKRRHKQKHDDHEARFITFGLVLFTVGGALAKKESAVPAVLSKQKQLALCP